MRPNDHPFDRHASLASEDRQRIDRLLDAVCEVLEQDIIGAYMHGSAVLGGLRPHSDIDVLVVSARPTSRAEKQLLVDRLVAISGRGPDRHVELTIVVQSEIRPWRYPPTMDFQYGEWLRIIVESGGDLEAWTSPNPDLASLLTMVLLGDWALLGPPPAEVLDPIPTHDFLDAAISSIGELLGRLDSDTRNVILTLARIWSAASNQKVSSKDGAATWALARLPESHQAVLPRARAIYRGEEEDRWDDVRDEVRAYADHVVGEIAKTARLDLHEVT